MKPAVWVLLLVAATGARADLANARAEPNLEKRSKLALENAQRALKGARDAYNRGDLKQVETLVAEVGESVELADTSLKETGKDPRKSPKWFKRAEIQTRDLLRKLDAFDQEMNFTDRPLLAKVRNQVREVHDNLLLGVMEGKRR